METRIDKAVLEHVRDRALFYPCAGQDILEPVTFFAPYVKDFWFADTGYFADGRPEQAHPVLKTSLGYRFLGSQVTRNLVPEREWKEDPKYHGIEPCVRTETYIHELSRERIRIHLHRRRGPTALRQLSEIGVFFYRSDGAEGSSTLWLTVHGSKRPNRRNGICLVHEVLDRLVDGGLFVTDGSKCEGSHNPYAELKRFRKEDVSIDEIKAQCHDFTDDAGSCFKFLDVSFKAPRYPTLFWQVRRLIGTTENGELPNA